MNSSTCGHPLTEEREDATCGQFVWVRQPGLVTETVQKLIGQPFVFGDQLGVIAVVARPRCVVFHG